MSEEKIRILVVDDHTLVREGFARMLDLSPDLEVVGQAPSAKDALELVTRLNPDIVLMDINLPGMNGIEATRIIKTEHPDVEVIILSMYDEEQYVLESVKAGATGYVLKDISPDDLLRAVKTVHHGGSMIQPSLARKVLREFANLAREAPVPGRAALLRELSEREMEVLHFVADGKSNREIAEAMTISEKTVKAHLRTIFRKLEVTDRAQAVAYAMRKGLVE
ncbi:MAG TPA: response regulator transcription factor [Candidatus Xenobia bacterium]|jgi:two-component system NarL family response regulator